MAKKNDNLRITSLKIERVNVTKDYGIFVDMTINGITIYGMKYMRKKGKNGYEFFSFPSRKGSDGNYYNVVWAFIDNGAKAEMIEAFREYCDWEDIDID